MKKLLLTCAIIPILLFAGCTSQENNNVEKNNIDNPQTEKESYKVIKDVWGREIKLDKVPERVALIDFTGTYVKCMKIWGIDDRVVAVDHSQKKNEFLKVVCPVVLKAVDVGSSRNINYETLAATKPDIVIVRAFVTTPEREEQYKDMVNKLTDMGIPVVILLHPTSFDKPNIKTMWEEIRILGQIFDKEKEANDLIDYLSSKINMISERTKDIPENERVRTLLFATPDYMLGAKTIQSYFLEEVVHGKNVLNDGGWLKTSPEDIIKLNPEAIIILGHAGYLSPEKVYEGVKAGIDWSLLKDVDAIKNRKVGSLGITEWRATIETPIGLLREAKTLYPNRFKDINPDEEEVKLYKEIYGLNGEQLQEAIKAQKYSGNPH
ncbi:ABC transporter substrate-binding protein [Methanocaldococcus sp.]